MKSDLHIERLRSAAAGVQRVARWLRDTEYSHLSECLASDVASIGDVIDSLGDEARGREVYEPMITRHSGGRLVYLDWRRRHAT